MHVEKVGNELSIAHMRQRRAHVAPTTPGWVTPWRPLSKLLEAVSQSHSEWAVLDPEAARAMPAR